MPSEPIPIPKTKLKKNIVVTTRVWQCEKNNGCMWSCPCDCNNCKEYTKLNIYTSK